MTDETRTQGYDLDSLSTKVCGLDDLQTRIKCTVSAFDTLSESMSSAAVLDLDRRRYENTLYCVTDHLRDLVNEMDEQVNALFDLVSKGRRKKDLT